MSADWIWILGTLSILSYAITIFLFLAVRQSVPLTTPATTVSVTTTVTTTTVVSNKGPPPLAKMRNSTTQYDANVVYKLSNLLPSSVVATDKFTASQTLDMMSVKQRPPHGFGYLAVIPEGNQFISSMPNGWAGLFQGQVPATRQNTNFDYVYDTVLPLVTSCEATSTSVETLAQNLGSLGERGSLMVNPDGTRLYLGYARVTTSLTSTTLLPFGQYQGQVAVWGKTSNTDTVWQPVCSLHLSHPLSSSQDPFYADEFGSLLRCALHPQTGLPVLAVGSRSGPNAGRAVWIYTEDINNHPVMESCIQAPSDYNSTDQASFGYHFDLGQDKLVVAVPSRNEVMTYVRDPTLPSYWTYQHTLTPPPEADGEAFGSSVVMNPLGTVLCVGSPKDMGGQVHTFAWNSTHAAWQRTGGVTDPRTSGGSFGQYLNRDEQGQLISVSMNLYHLTTPTALTNASDPVPEIAVFMLNQGTAQIHTPVFVQIPQPVDSVQFPLTGGLADPYFGRQVSMTLTSEFQNKAIILASSPANQLFQYHTWS